MTTLLETLQKDQLNARKNKNEVETSVLTVLYSDAVNFGKNKGNRLTTDDEVIAIIKKFVNTSKENLAIYKEKEKIDAVARTEQEILILSRYLPASVPEQELKDTIAQLVTDNGWAKENATMGKVMKELKTKYGSSLDGGLTSKLIKDYLAS